MPREGNAAQKRQTIRKVGDALFGLMEVEPYEKITISQIAGRAGVSRMAFYRNYESKDDVVSKHLAGLFSRLKALSTEGAAPSQRQAALEYFRIMQENQHAVLLLLKAGKGALLYNELFEHVTGGYRAVFGGKSTEADRYRVASICGIWFGCTLEWMEGGCRESPDEMAEIFSSFTSASSEAERLNPAAGPS